MKKLKKYQRVEIFLTKLMKSDGYSEKKLLRLDYKEIVNDAELDGIGDRTICNVLKAFKRKHCANYTQVAMKSVRKSDISRFLKRQLNSGELTVEKLTRLTAEDLKSIPRFKHTTESILSSVLESFKTKYKNISFENSVLDFLQSESRRSVGTVDGGFNAKNRINSSRTTESAQLQRDDMVLLKKMIRRYGSTQDSEVQKTTTELEELKLALRYVGINHETILKKYLAISKKRSSSPAFITGNIANNSFPATEAG